MIDRKVLKSRAKAVMARSYTKMLIACVIVNLITGGGLGISTKRLQNMNMETMTAFKLIATFMILSAICIIAIGLSIFVMEPLIVGLKKFMLETSRRDSEITILYEPFKVGYKNIVLTQFMKNLFIFLWSLPSLIPTIVLGVSTGSLARLQILAMRISDGNVQAALELLGILNIWMGLTLILSLPAIIKSLQYSMVSYILADNSATDWKSALSESKEMMVGNKWEYVKLIISFIPWYIVANLCCCIGNFLLLPYIEATFAEFYLEISGQNLTYTQYDIN